jgi:hypothetical protein
MLKWLGNNAPEVALLLVLIEVGWRWAYKVGTPLTHRYSPIYQGKPTAHAVAAANNSSFGPVRVQKVYVLQEDDDA